MEPRRARAQTISRSGTSLSAACSPGIAHHALAGIAAGHVGELALEGGRRRPAVQPFHFGRCGGERGVAGLSCAVDENRRAGQRLEARRETAVRIEIVCPGGAATKREHTVSIAKDLSVRTPSSLRESVTLFAP